MPHFIDPNRFFARASHLCHAILAAIARRSAPSVTRLRRMLIRFEGDVTFWLLWLYYSQPAGTYGPATLIAHAAQTRSIDGKCKRAPPLPKSSVHIKSFVLRLSNAGPWPSRAHRSENPFRPRPTRDQQLFRLGARLASLLGVLQDPKATLRRIAHTLARTTAIPIITRDLVESTNALTAEGFFASKSRAPEPHKRE